MVTFAYLLLNGRRYYTHRRTIECDANNIEKRPLTLQTRKINHRARNKWHLAITLLHNPQFVILRKRELAESRKLKNMQQQSLFK
jgi:hypothetical protein